MSETEDTTPLILSFCIGFWQDQSGSNGTHPSPSLCLPFYKNDLSQTVGGIWSVSHAIESSRPRKVARTINSKVPGLDPIYGSSIILTKSRLLQKHRSIF
jgi:hypothetical protein